MKNKILIAGKKTLNNFKQSIPIIMGIIFFISLAQTFISVEKYAKLFSGGFFDPLIGATIGSVASGNPITSYIIGGELLKNNVSFIAVAAFIVAWVTVGVIQFPAESLMLGKKFALTRNILAFVSSIIIAIIIGLVFNLFYV